MSSGLISNGMLDKSSHSYPDLEMILNTCKTVEYTQACKSVLRSKFSELYEQQMNFWILSDDFMEQYGFRQDRDLKRNIIRRTSQCEDWQRSKNLSYDYQRVLRENNVI